MSSVGVCGGTASSEVERNLQLPPVLMPDEAGALQAAIMSGNADQVARSCGWSTIRALCLLPTGRSCMEEAVVHNHPGVLRLLIAFTPRGYMCPPIASCRDTFLAAAMKCDALALHRRHGQNRHRIAIQVHPPSKRRLDGRPMGDSSASKIPSPPSPDGKNTQTRMGFRLGLEPL